MPRMIATSARLGPLLAMQSEEQRHNIENAISKGAKKYATNVGIEIPASVLLAVARKL